MADKKKPSRSEKMYADGPRLERKEDGKMGVTKKQKKAAEVNSGTDGIPEHESHALALSQKHEKERLDLHHKHEKEHHDLAAKHMKEASPAAEETPKEQEKDKGEE